MIATERERERERERIEAARTRERERENEEIKWVFKANIVGFIKFKHTMIYTTYITIYNKTLKNNILSTRYNILQHNSLQLLKTTNKAHVTTILCIKFKKL